MEGVDSGVGESRNRGGMKFVQDDNLLVDSNAEIAEISAEKTEIRLAGGWQAEACPT